MKELRTLSRWFHEWSRRSCRKHPAAARQPEVVFHCIRLGNLTVEMVSPEGGGL
jgi:hypothetical protein